MKRPIRILAGLLLIFGSTPALAGEGASIPVRALIQGDGAAQTLDAPVSMGGNDADGVELSAPNSEAHKIVTTCRAYNDATAQGWYARTTYDMSMESFFIRQCGFLDLREAAQESSTSFFDEYFPQQTDFNQLPTGMMDVFAVGEPYECDGLSLNACLQKYKGTFTINDEHNIAYEDEGMSGIFAPTLRGDINHDGFEDVVMRYAAYAKGGTLRYYGYFCLTRTDALVTSSISCTTDFKKE